MLKRLLKINRYFIVMITAIDKGRNYMIVKTFITNGSYLNYNSIFDEINEKTGLEKLQVTNIIEISRSDYKDFIKHNKQ